MSRTIIVLFTMVCGSQTIFSQISKPDSLVKSMVSYFNATQHILHINSMKLVDARRINTFKFDRGEYGFGTEPFSNNLPSHVQCVFDSLNKGYVPNSATRYKYRMDLREFDKTPQHFHIYVYEFDDTTSVNVILKMLDSQWLSFDKSKYDYDAIATHDQRYIAFDEISHSYGHLNSQDLANKFGDAYIYCKFQYSSQLYGNQMIKWALKTPCSK